MTLHGIWCGKVRWTLCWLFYWYCVEFLKIVYGDLFVVCVARVKCIVACGINRFSAIVLSWLNGYWYFGRLVCGVCSKKRRVQGCKWKGAILCKWSCYMWAALCYKSNMNASFKKILCLLVWFSLLNWLVCSLYCIGVVN